MTGWRARVEEMMKNSTNKMNKEMMNEFRSQ